MENEDFQKTLDVLKKGGIILYPTETIWGIGCDATNPEAVKKIYSLKQRADGKAMISLVDSLEMLEQWVENVPEAARKAISESKGALSIIYDHPKGIAGELLADDGSAAFRITSLPFAAKLAHGLGRPLVSTSANISGHPTAGNFSEIEEEIKSGVDYIVETGREIPAGCPSSVMKITDEGLITVLR